jgi:hypothetical protein
VAGAHFENLLRSDQKKFSGQFFIPKFWDKSCSKVYKQIVAAWMQLSDLMALKNHVCKIVFDSVYKEIVA